MKIYFQFAPRTSQQVPVMKTFPVFKENNWFWWEKFSIFPRYLQNICRQIVIKIEAHCNRCSKVFLFFSYIFKEKSRKVCRKLFPFSFKRKTICFVFLFEYFHLVFFFVRLSSRIYCKDFFPIELERNVILGIIKYFIHYSKTLTFSILLNLREEKSVFDCLNFLLFIYINHCVYLIHSKILPKYSFPRI